MTVEAIATYPAYLDQLSKLVDEHRRQLDEPVLLALYYSPDREPSSIFLFEVLDNFGLNRVDPDKRLFEVVYKSTPSFPLPWDQNLNITLTNPVELEAAARQGWTDLTEIKDAIREGRATKIYCATGRDDLWRLLIEAE